MHAEQAEELVSFHFEVEAVNGDEVAVDLAELLGADPRGVAEMRRALARGLDGYLSR